MAKIENEVSFVDIAVGDMRLRIPNDLESVTMAKMHIEALYKSFPKSFEEKGSNTQVIDLATPQAPTETIEQMPELAPKKLPVIEEQKEVKVEPSQESYTLCPLCSGKLKKKRIKQIGSELRQKVLCKTRKCNFQREYVFSV